MSGSTAHRSGCSLALVGAAIVAVVGLVLVWPLLSNDEASAAEHFAQVVHEVVPHQQTIDLACEEGSSPPQVLLHRKPAAVRARLRRNGWRRVRAGWYRRRFDEWTADVTVGLDGFSGESITVTLEYDLDCADLKDELHQRGFRV